MLSLLLTLGEDPPLDFSQRHRPAHSLRSESVYLHGGLSVWIPEGRTKGFRHTLLMENQVRVKRPFPLLQGDSIIWDSEVDFQTHRPGVESE